VTPRELVVEEAEKAADEWATEAKRRRTISKADPIADTLDYCAGDLKKRLENVVVVSDDDRISVEEYAALPNVDRSPQTVRAWIRRGLLPAKSTPRGYRIRKNEQPVRDDA
jgi:hypothetical protein